MRLGGPFGAIRLFPMPLRFGFLGGAERDPVQPASQSFRRSNGAGFSRQHKERRLERILGILLVSKLDV